MRTLTTVELQRELADGEALAATEPVAITRQGREELVLLSMEEYRRLKRSDCEALLVEELSDEDLEAIGKAEVPAEYAYLNAELSKP